MSTENQGHSDEPIRVDTAGGGETLRRDLAGVEAIALDCEAAGFHRYSDRICLLQLSTPEQTYILDPLAFDPADYIRDAVEDPGVAVILHGSDYDLRLLDRDLGLRVHGLVDTQTAAALLGEEALGLSALLEKYLDLRLSKKYQRADWAIRPLPADMVSYAAGDTRYLHQLVELLTEKLEEAGRLGWAEEECLRLEDIRWEDESDVDPVTRVKKARGLGPREATALREALLWRDGIARERDRALFRVAQDSSLLSVVLERPTNVQELGQLQGISPALARRHGARLLSSIAAVDRLPEEELKPYPRPVRSGPGRLTPEEEERANDLKKVRNRRADELKLARGTLLNNATLANIARSNPDSTEKLREVQGLRRWQVDVVGQLLLDALG